jgi:hypothetical protein
MIDVDLKKRHSEEVRIKKNELRKNSMSRERFLRVEISSSGFQIRMLLESRRDHHHPPR